MKTLCIIADTHKRHRELVIPECDLLIHCGDMCSFHQDDHGILEDIDVWFAESAAKRVICVGGNHDYLLQSREFKFAHAKFLEDDGVEIDGLTIYGSPWCPDLSGCAYYQCEDDLIERWKAIPSGVDILVTHTPPYGVLDIPTSGSPNLGCKHLLSELKRIAPRYHVFGHIHASHGRVTKSQTEFINAAIVGGRDFEVRHQPTLLALQ